MKLIVGLGNPGKIYINSRHNIGFSVVKALAQNFKVPLKKDKYAFSLSGKARIEGQEVILLLPLTFMNLSGLAIKALSKKYKVDLTNLLVVLDDLDLEIGRIKVKADGGSAGHRGIKSIIEQLGSKDFSRLKIGIGRPEGKEEISDYVLSSFKKREKKKIEEAIIAAKQCCVSWVRHGTEKTMSKYNKYEGSAHSAESI